MKKIKRSNLLAAMTTIATVSFSLPVPAVAGDFRTITGLGNNPLDPTLGAAGTQLGRLFTPAYEDGFNEPRGGPIGSSHLPNPRTISNTIANQTRSVPNFLSASDWLWQWGQFIDHDLDLNEASGENPPAPEDIMPIPVPPDPRDPLVEKGITQIPFIRVPAVEGTGIPGTPRAQANQITSFIDASSVYGSDRERATFLRTADGTGRLKTTIGDNGETLLSFNTAGLPNATGGILTDPNEQYIAGDIRANEQIGLLAVHTLMVREHNRLADDLNQRLNNGDPQLKEKLTQFVTDGGGDPDNPTSDELDEWLYQTARKVVGAEIQIITYNEFLPLLVGSKFTPVDGVFSNGLGIESYQGYNSGVDPSISIEFANAAYRLGHTLLSDQLLRVDEEGTTATPLADAFFSPGDVTANGVDSLFLGLASQKSQELDNLIGDSVRNFLFPAATGALDLASVNIGRGRDGGIPSYVDVYSALGLGTIARFEDLPFDPAVIALFEAAYDGVEQIDLWIGAISELPVNGGLLGPTFNLIVSDQFERLRDGDRFFYLAPAQLDHLLLLDPQLLAVTLSEILRRNSNDFVAARIQDNAFIYHAQNVPEPSSAIPFLLVIILGVRWKRSLN